MYNSQDVAPSPYRRTIFHQRRKFFMMDIGPVQRRFVTLLLFFILLFALFLSYWRNVANWLLAAIVAPLITGIIISEYTIRREQQVNNKERTGKNSQTRENLSSEADTWYSRAYQFSRRVQREKEEWESNPNIFDDDAQQRLKPIVKGFESEVDDAQISGVDDESIALAENTLEHCRDVLHVLPQIHSESIKQDFENAAEGAQKLEENVKQYFEYERRQSHTDSVVNGRHTKERLDEKQAEWYRDAVTFAEGVQESQKFRKEGDEIRDYGIEAGQMDSTQHKLLHLVMNFDSQVERGKKLNIDIETQNAAEEAVEYAKIVIRESENEASNSYENEYEQTLEAAENLEERAKEHIGD